MKEHIGDRAAVGLLMGTSMLIGAAVYFSAPAKAGPDTAAIVYASQMSAAVCATLDDYPTKNGVLGIAQAIREDGLSFDQAAWVIILSVTEQCPRHLDVLHDFAGAPEVLT